MTQVMDLALQTHLEGGLTTLAHAWAISRRDGVVLGFTDHDRDLSFDGITFRADTGMNALALSQSTGLSVDNTEAVGALSDLSIRDQDIEQGRFDFADVRAWLVNWADVRQRRLQFRGKIGELRRIDGGFQAELRGLTDALNQPIGRVYQTPCGAVLGDAACGVDLNLPAYSIELITEYENETRMFRWLSLTDYAPGWFTRGRLDVLSGSAKGLWGMIKSDRSENGARVIELWEPIAASVPVGTMVRLRAGCDKRASTCREKFDNFYNYQGFPDVPGEDWMMSVPRSGNPNTGGSRR